MLAWMRDQSLSTKVHMKSGYMNVHNLVSLQMLVNGIGSRSMHVMLAWSVLDMLENLTPG